MKKTYSSATSYPFIVSFVDRINGEISISMGRSDTSSITEGRYVYDITLTSPTNIRTRVVQGNIIVSPGVTL
jgi:hypothetical protein